MTDCFPELIPGIPLAVQHVACKLCKALIKMKFIQYMGESGQFFSCHQDPSAAVGVQVDLLHVINIVSIRNVAVDLIPEPARPVAFRYAAEIPRMDQAVAFALRRFFPQSLMDIDQLRFNRIVLKTIFLMEVTLCFPELQVDMVLICFDIQVFDLALLRRLFPVVLRKLQSMDHIHYGFF